MRAALNGSWSQCCRVWCGSRDPFNPYTCPLKAPLSHLFWQIPDSLFHKHWVFLLHSSLEDPMLTPLAAVDTDDWGVNEDILASGFWFGEEETRKLSEA